MLLNQINDILTLSLKQESQRHFSLTSGEYVCHFGINNAMWFSYESMDDSLWEMYLSLELRHLVPDWSSRPFRLVEEVWQRPSYSELIEWAQETLSQVSRRVAVDSYSGIDSEILRSRLQRFEFLARGWKSSPAPCVFLDAADSNAEDVPVVWDFKFDEATARVNMSAEFEHISVEVMRYPVADTLWSNTTVKLRSGSEKLEYSTGVYKTPHAYEKALNQALIYYNQGIHKSLPESEFIARFLDAALRDLRKRGVGRVT